MADIEIKNLTQIFSRGTPFEKKALENISLSIPAGQFVGLLGHTGSGKSTLIMHLNALLSPTSGEILVGGKNINADKASRREVKSRVGIVFQYPEYQLFEETVSADIAFGPKNMGLDEKEIEARVREAADFAGVEEELFEKSPLDLSGGQKRRIAIAGVIAMRPEILVLDEPTAGLDPEGRDQIIANICRYNRETGATIITVSHDMDTISRVAERLIALDHGRLAIDGAPEEVFSCPEKLRQIGLGIPSATEIGTGLKLKTPVYTHEQLLQAIRRAKEGKTC